MLLLAGDDHNAGRREVFKAVFLESRIERPLARFLQWERGVHIEFKDVNASTFERPLEVAQAPTIQVPGSAQVRIHENTGILSTKANHFLFFINVRSLRATRIGRKS